jgi:hypothetical protein
MHSSFKSLLVGAVSLCAGQFASAVVVQYDFQGVFAFSQFNSVVHAGDAFNTRIVIDYSAPFSGASGGPGYEWAWFKDALLRFDFTFPGGTLALNYTSELGVSYSTVDRSRYPANGFGFYSPVYIDGSPVARIAVITYPNGGAAVPLTFSTYGDLVPVLSPSAFSFYLDIYDPATASVKYAFTTVTSAQMRVLGGVPDGGSTGVLLAAALAGCMFVRSRMCRCRSCTR